jgi:DNA-binding protein HU-beta
MNQKDLIERVRIQGAHNNEQILNAVTKKTAEAWLDAVCRVAAKALDDGEEVTLPGLGKFKVAFKAARTGRNPATGEAMQIPAKYVVKFVPSKSLKGALA